MNGDSDDDEGNGEMLVENYADWMSFRSRVWPSLQKVRPVLHLFIVCGVLVDRQLGRASRAS